MVLMKVMQRSGSKYDDPEYILIIVPHHIEPGRPISCVINGRSYYGHCEASVIWDNQAAVIWVISSIAGKSVMIHLSPLLFEEV